MILSHALRIPSQGRKKATYITATDDAVDRTTYTFASQSIGTATNDRVVIVCVAGGSTNNRTITGVTLGGTSMSVVVDNGNTNPCCAIYKLAVSSGTTASVVVTFSAGQTRCAIAIYSFTGWGNVTTYSTDNKATNTVTTVASSVNNKQYGYAIAVFQSLQTGGLNRTLSSTSGTGSTDANLNTETPFRAVFASTGSSLLSANSTGTNYAATFSGNTFYGSAIAVFI